MGVGVPTDQRGVVVEVVNPAIAVHVEDMASLSPYLKRREGRKIGGAAGRATRQHPLGPSGHLDRTGIRSSVFVNLPPESGRDS
jgi:hypothetical protein